MADGVVRVLLATLKPHPLNIQIYDGRPVDDLAPSIAEHGLVETHAATAELANCLICADMAFHHDWIVHSGWVVGLSGGLRYHWTWNDDQPSSA